MKLSSKLTKLLAIILPILVMVSCVDDDDNGNVIEGNNSIVNYFQKDPDYSLFLNAINKVGLAGTLDGNSGTYTIFAPNNEAVNAYLEAHDYASLNDIPDDKLYQLVTYHILESLNKKENFVTGYFKTLATTAVNDSTEVNLSLYVNSEEDTVEFNGTTTIETPDIEVDNGIMHQVSSVLELPSMKTFLSADTNLQPFYEALTTEGTETDFETYLSGNDNPHLLFAPNATAMQTFYDEEGITDASELPADELDNMLRYSFVSEGVLSSTFVNQYKKTLGNETITGEGYSLSVYVSTNLGLMLNGTSRIVIPDIVTINGIINVTDTFLRLPTLTDFVTADVELTTLLAAFSREDQAGELYLERLAEGTESATTPYTLFAPTNEAYSNVLLELFPTQDASIDTIETAQMTHILDLHLISNSNLRAEAISEGSLSTNGGTLSVNADGTLTDEQERTATFVKTDIQATNGIMHTLDTVLLP